MWVPIFLSAYDVYRLLNTVMLLNVYKRSKISKLLYYFFFLEILPALFNKQRRTRRRKINNFLNAIPGGLSMFL